MIWIVWSILALAGWWWLLRRTPRGLGGLAPAGRWHLGDAIISGFFALYFIFLIFADDGKPHPVTPDIMRESIVFYLLIIVMIAGVVFGRGQSPQQAFGLAPAHPARVIGLGIACILITYPLVQLAEQAAALLGHSASEGDDMVQYLRGKLSMKDTAAAVAMAVILAPLAEELVFRGYLYGVFKKYGGQVAATLTSALLFAAVHQNLPAMPAYFLLAVALSLAYELTGSLWASIVMHMLFNLVPVVVLLYFPQWIP